MNLIKPEILKKGDTIEFIAPSGFVKNKDEVFRAKEYFENKGFKVILADNIFAKNKYFAGEDDLRAKDLNDAFLNPEVKAIIAVRGGYGAIRLLDKIDYEAIKKNPKIFVGYSDITALSAMFLKKAGLITYSAPMAVSGFGSEVSKFSEKWFFETLMSENELVYDSDKTYENKNSACGITFGGNLSTVVSLCGLDFIPDEDFIFFIEDLNEPVYKIDKMMSQLINIPEFRNKIKGLVIGEFLDVDNEIWLKDLFEEISENLNIPIVGSFKITHAKDKLSVPYGAKAEIKANKFIICNKKG